MAKYYKEISRMLALGEESFEDELRRIVSTRSFLFLALDLLTSCPIFVDFFHNYASFTGNQYDASHTLRGFNGIESCANEAEAYI